MPDFQRDITLTGGTNDLFVAPGNYDYWLYNPPTNASVTVSKVGKAPQVISPGEVFVVHLSKGDELAISGTSGNILSIYDKADVKLIPTSKDILGKVQVVDSNGNIVNFPKPSSGSTILTSGNQTTTSTTFVSVNIGIGTGFKPNATGTVLLLLHTDMSNNTAGDGVQCAIFYNTTGVPALGTGVGSDTQVAKDQLPTIATANERRSMGVIGLVTLSVGTTYYPYIAFAAITGGTATMVGVGATVIIAVELAVT